ncbi:MAG: DVUA0089 family protein [Pseudomonadota bacterium]
MLETKSARKLAITTLFLLGVLALIPQANAVVIEVTRPVVSGTIEPQGSGTTIDYLVFEVDTPGTVTIDILSQAVLAGDGPGNLSALDTDISLFEFDSSGDLDLLGNFIIDNDTANFPTEGADDGSVEADDSFLSINLAAGTYVVVIADFGTSESNMRDGGPGSIINGGTFGDYQVTFTGIRLEEPIAVPLPASFTFLLALLLWVTGIVFTRQKRFRR